jgi:hypothetical protein
MTIQFHDHELTKMIIHAQDVDITNFEDKELPNDIHVIQYLVDGKVIYDAVRSYKMSDIFDVYYDRLKPMGGKVLSIKSGYGTIKPKLYNPNPPKKG